MNETMEHDKQGGPRVKCAKTGEVYPINIQGGRFTCPGCNRQHEA